MPDGMRDHGHQVWVIMGQDRRGRSVGMGEIKLRVRFNKEHERAGTSLKDGKQIVVKFQGFTPEKKL